MDLQEKTDSELITLCRKGDENAFAELYQRYRLRLFSYIHKLLPDNHALAEDIFQQVWLKAAKNWERYDDQQKLLAWLCRIAHNLVMDLYRTERHLDREPLTNQDAITDAEDVNAVLDRKAFSQALEKAIQTLPENQRLVIEQRRKGLSFKEIANQENSSINTILGRMHYAVLRLREQLQDYL